MRLAGEQDQSQARERHRRTPMSFSRLVERLTRGAVLKAVAEYDDTLQAKFLEKYRCGYSKGIFLIVGEKEYDAKAIVCAAYGYQFPGEVPLDPKTFTSGDERFQPMLRKLGFEVRDRRAKTLDPPVCFPDEVAESVLTEGAKKAVVVNAYERSPEARRQCLAVHGTTCCICGFDFGAFYGTEFAGFIHVHHLKPLAEIGEEYEVDPVNDLRPVCPNCHAVLHFGSRCRSVEEVREEIDKASQSRRGNL